MGAILASTIKQGRYSNISPSANAVDGGKARFKVGYVTAGDTIDDGDTITINIYDKFKMNTLLGIVGFIHTTTDSVIVEEAPTTTVDMETLTITVGGSTDDKKRFYALYGI